MPTDPSSARALLAYAVQVVSQASEIAASFDGTGEPAYPEQVGPHLRHLIEHFDAWLVAAGATRLDYDARVRDPGPAHHPGLARRRLQGIAHRLAQWPPAALDAPLEVHADIGTAGEQRCTVVSSAGRELLYLCQHAVHHYALLKPHVLHHGLALGDDFGKAPATIAHERRTASAPSCPHPDSQEDDPCLMTPQAA
jgi:hypothetical protein